MIREEISEENTNRGKRNRTYRNHREWTINSPKTHFGTNVFQTEKKEQAPQIGDKITPKNRHCVPGVDGKYIQWNEILRDILNGKLKIFQNRTRKSESESESDKGEKYEESDFEIENPDTSERDGYKPITTNPGYEL